jgi:glycosyltransferase involved in cell wall biosynthesis
MEAGLMGHVKVSIITVCLNSKRTIKQTIESVLDQSYRNLEYLVMDGGSKDGTAEILKSYNDDFKKSGVPYRWVSEPDRGIYDAMNKGIAMATGELIGIINSDDWYERDAVENVIRSYEEDIAVYHGFLRTIRKERERQIVFTSPDELAHGVMIEHPACFVKKSAYERIGKYSLDFKLASDLDFMIKAFKSDLRFKKIDAVIANFRTDGRSFTGFDVVLETLKIQLQHGIISKKKYLVSLIGTNLNRASRVLFRGR